MKSSDRKWFEKYLEEKFKHIDNHFIEVKSRLDRKANKTDVENLRIEVRNIKLTSAIVGGIGGLLVTVGSYFGFLRRG